MNYVSVPYEHLERQRKHQERERDRAARARAELRWKDDRRTHNTQYQKRFVGWDGEGPRDAGYALFGNSDGDEICHPYIHTREALDLMIAHKRENPDTIDVWFGGDYDVSMILTDLPRRHMTALHEYNKTVWLDYQIEHIPHKWFKLRRGEISVILFDIHSFFDSGYADALDSWKIGTPEERAAIVQGKANRADFVWVDIEDIRAYFRLELRLMPPLCEKLREVFADAGYVPRSWHGPGALARMALQRHHVYDAMAATPKAVSEAARFAFAAGRFELVKAGWFHGTVYNYDIHSAYPYFATFLPNLRKGVWRRTQVFEPGKYGVYRIRYEARDANLFSLYPLFRRLPNAGVAWPHRVTGWYWSPEAELVADDQDAEFLDGWVFDEDDPTDRPFAWLLEYYNRRMILKNSGQAAEYTFKLIINAVYGQLAQRVGWNRKNGKPPRTHQLEWAGFITSACRAAVYKAACNAGEKLVSIDTDGLYALAPIEGLDLGDSLGQWESAEYEDGVFWQSGVYCLKTAEGWKKARTRGIPKGTYKPEELLEHLETLKPLTVWKNIFIGYGMADNGQWEKRNTWERKEIVYVFGGGGKRSHLQAVCQKFCHGDIHVLTHPLGLYEGNPDSKPHYLPWEDNEQLMTTVKELGYFAVNQEDPDSEELGWAKAPMTWLREWRPTSPLKIRGQHQQKNARAAGQHTKARKRHASLLSRLTTSRD